MNYLNISHHSRETAKLFINALVEPEFSSRIHLQYLHLRNSGLLEEDLKQIISDLLPVHPMIEGLSIPDNDIGSLQTIKDMALVRPPNNTLRFLMLTGNPCFFNLEDSVSSDHVAAISLLKSFNRLSFLGHSKDTSKPTSEIEYWTKINRGWRFLVDGTGNAANGKMLPLNLWSKVLERAYRTSNGGPYASTLPGERICFHIARRKRSYT